jgi:hypothetical protein
VRANTGIIENVVIAFLFVALAALIEARNPALYSLSLSKKLARRLKWIARNAALNAKRTFAFYLLPHMYISLILTTIKAYFFISFAILSAFHLWQSICPLVVW